MIGGVRNFFYNCTKSHETIQKDVHDMSIILTYKFGDRRFGLTQLMK